MLVIKERVSPDAISLLLQDEVFVFGSNKQGMHRKGAALLAKQRFGAIEGIGSGLCGQSYAIPTRTIIPGKGIYTLTVSEIRPRVAEFIEHAEANQHLKYLVTMIGCGYAGHKAADIAPLFEGALFVKNILLPLDFWKIILGA